MYRDHRNHHIIRSPMKSKVPETNRLDRKKRQSLKKLEEQTRLRNKVIVNGFNTGMLTDTTLALVNWWHTRCHTQRGEMGRCAVTLPMFVSCGLESKWWTQSPYLCDRIRSYCSLLRRPWVSPQVTDVFCSPATFLVVECRSGSYRHAEPCQESVA